jgi:hypothetical protein
MEKVKIRDLTRYPLRSPFMATVKEVAGEKGVNQYLNDLIEKDLRAKGKLGK